MRSGLGLYTSIFLGQTTGLRIGVKLRTRKAGSQVGTRDNDLSFPLGGPQVETHNPTMTMGRLIYTRTLPIELWGAAIAMALSLRDPGAYGGAGRTYRCQPGSVNEELQGRKVQISAHGYRQARWRHLLLTKKHGFILKDSGFLEVGEARSALLSR